ncbi:MAG: DUF2089 family protein [Planctomycetota bacterium]|jgi:hypothetical protein
MVNQLPQWMNDLSDEDCRFIKRFILASGSLKEMAVQYGISYPTVRNRLDRLIEKVKILESTKEKTEFHKKVKILAAEGKLDLNVARELIRTYERSTDGKE